jgi:hypothetical protein
LSKLSHAGNLEVHPQCLLFFLDETGHEEFADPTYPIFGVGGCAVMAGAVDDVLRKPWRKLKDKYFDGANVPLHANELNNPTPKQLDALNAYFQSKTFGRFAVTITKNTTLPLGMTPYDIIPNAVRMKWSHLSGQYSGFAKVYRV